MSEDLKRAKAQAAAQYDSIVEMVAAVKAADESGDEEAREEARRTIEEDALSVEVRGDWHAPGDKEGSEPTEYRILLCTGGPAVQIIGNLSEHNEPESARIQYQDWFTPWVDWHSEEHTASDIEQVLLSYAQTFYFGD